MQDLEVFQKEIGMRIMERRKKLGFTQESLGEMSNLTTQFVCYAESGRREMKASSISKIAKALGVSTDYILNGFIGDKDRLLLSEKMERLSVDEFKLVEGLVDHIIELYHKDE